MKYLYQLLETYNHNNIYWVDLTASNWEKCWTVSQGELKLYTIALFSCMSSRYLISFKLELYIFMYKTLFYVKANAIKKSNLKA